MTTFDRIESYFLSNEPLFILGPPGVGKSQMVQQIAAKHDAHCEDVRLSLMDPVDLRGLPMVDKGEKMVEWAAPDFFQSLRMDDRLAVLLWDELNTAPIAVQNAALQVLTEKKLGPHVLGNRVWQVACGNKTEHGAHVNPLSAPIRNRFNIIEVEPNLDEFTQYAVENKFHDDVISCLNFQSDLLYQLPKDEYSNFPSPRSWERVSRLLFAGMDDFVAIKGAIGTGAATSFLAYRKESSQLPDMDKLISGEVDFSFEGKPASVSYACVVSMATRSLENLKKVDDCARVTQGITPEIAALYYAIIISSSNTKAMQAIMESKNAQKWMQTHRKLVSRALG